MARGLHRWMAWRGLAHGGESRKSSRGGLQSADMGGRMWMTAGRDPRTVRGRAGRIYELGNVMNHEANAWIASKWMGALVRQVSSCDGPTAPEIGRLGKVAEVMFDENGAAHCRITRGDEEWWCPASRLDIVTG